MAILNINIPQSARRLVPSAPHSAVHPPPSMAASAGPASALATPVPGVHMHTMHELAVALSGLTSLEDLLTSLRSKASRDRQMALENFRDALRKEEGPLLAGAPGSTQQNPSFLSDAMTAKLTSFASLDELDAKWAVVSAIEEILRVHTPDKKSAARLALALFRVIPCSDVAITRKAAKLYATLILLDGMAVMAESQSQTMLEWIEADSRSERKRLGAIIFFTEIFSDNEARAVVAQHIPRTVHSLWDSALQDHKLEIREAGKLALEVCVANMSKSDVIVHREILLNDVLSVLSPHASSAYQIHGALLTACVLARTVEGGDSSIQLLWPYVLKAKDKDLHSTRAAMEFMTIAAEKTPAAFLLQWLQPTMTWLCEAMKRERDHNAAIVAIARILPVAKYQADAWLDSIVHILHDGLTHIKRTPGQMEALLALIGGCATAFGPAIEKALSLCIDSMFLGPLTPALVEAAECIATNIPGLAYMVRVRLLDCISIIITGTSFQEYATPASSGRRASVASLREGRPSHERRRSASLLVRARARSISPMRDLVSTQKPEDGDEPDTVSQIQALHYLGAVDFGQQPLLLGFIQHQVAPLMSSADVELRRAATQACCEFLAKACMISTVVKDQPSSAVREIVHAVMLVGVADNNAVLRVEALTALGQPHLDKYLIEHESVRMLICALNDETLDVRLAVIKLLARTASSTKATVLPSLRTELTGLLTVLDQTIDGHARHQILTVLVHIIDAAPSLATLYAQPIMQVLSAQLQTMEEERLVLVAFELTRGLARYAGRCLREKAITFVQYTLQGLRDQASAVKRRSAVVTLTDIVAYTACMSEVSSLRDDFIDLLVAHLATETSTAEKREAVRALGMLGASRPSLSPEDVTEKLIKTWSLDAEAISSASSLESGLISTDPDVMRIRMPLYIADWVLNQLITIWREPGLKALHPAVADAIVRIFRHERSRVRSWHFLNSIIPCFLDAINDRSLDTTSTCFYIAALGKVSRVAETRVEEHIQSILGALMARWDDGLEPTNCIVEAIADLAVALRGSFQRYLPLVIAKICNVLRLHTCSEATALAALRLLQETAALLRDWTHIIIPALLATAETPTSNNSMAVMDTLLALSCSAHITPHLSRILPVLHRMYLCPHLSDKALRTMCSIAKECGKEANSFVRGFERHVGIIIIGHCYYNEYLEGTGGTFEPRPEEADDTTEVPDLNVDSIVTAFRPPSGTVSWSDWLQNLTSSVVKASNNHHIRASAPVSEAYPPLQRQLINYATYTDWIDLPKEARSEICDHLSEALSMQATLEVHDMVLHLTDFMSRMGIELPISPRLCKEAALRRSFLHRASRYAELENAEAFDESVINDLLKIEHDFQHREPDHALGLLTMTSQSTVEWAELGQWHQTLQSYDAELAKDPESHSAIRGVSRCLHALQEWDILLTFGESKVNTSDIDLQRAVAPIIASAAWSVNRFDTMEQAITLMQGPERAWYSGVLATIENDLPAAELHINTARDMLCKDLVSMRGTRSGRAYDLLVRTQLLTELEEAGRYRLFESERPLIRERWTHRLGKLQKEIEVMQRCLKIHSLAIPPSENAKAMTKYARICRKAGRNDLAYKVLASTMAVGSADPLNFGAVAKPESEFPGLTLERCALAYDFADKEIAKDGLRGLVMRLSDRLDVLSKLPRRNRALTDKMDEETTLLARCLHTLGDYVKHDDMSSLFEAQIAYEKSADLEPTAKGLRKLASVNLQIIETYNASVPETPTETIVALAVAVIDCYAQIIQKSTYFPLQDILGILTVIFKYGQHTEAVIAAKRAFDILSIDCWLEVVPQLTAQLNYPSNELQPVVEKHMQKLARAHPQAMLSNLAAVAQYPSKERAGVAKRLLNVMRLYDDDLVQEALLVNRELRKCSMSPEEVCIVGIERASKYLFGDEPRNPVGMIKMLEDMSQGFEEPETVGEMEFNSKYSASIRSAIALGKRYLTNQNEKDLGQIWKKWHAIHKDCAASVKESAMSFHLASACPRLERCRNMKYAVPGTSQIHFGDSVNIQRFGSVVEILSSKQRPRKLSILGDDGKEYKYLLKGREDLRLDERCVQLFTLVNHLLSRDTDAARRHLRMVKYAVIPLSHDAGLLSWFERGDTLHTVVRQHRRINNLAMDAELKLTAQISPHMSKGTLTSMQQVEVFEIASECSKGDEIRSMLWRKSTSTSAWLERRTRYARSLAVSSMVGHLLGLGDRHPSNVLMDRVTGEIVQIDYGDAFEAAQERDSFPERVPFRCTRQLVNALPVTGVEGLFRLTSQLVMKVLRDNKESIEAVFSSFVHDPLIQHLVLNPRQLTDIDEPAKPLPADEDDQIANTQNRSQIRRRKTASVIEGTVTDLSPRAQRVVNRVKQKLEGMEFGTAEALTVESQVDVLILQATDTFNLSASYGGWCPWW